MSENFDVYQAVTDRIVAALESGTVPWQVPWHGGAEVPRSINGRPYRGINVILLNLTKLEHGYSSSRWGTYKRLHELGGQVRKGEHSTLVVLWKQFRVKDKDDPTKTKVIPVLRYFRVFNADQCDWPNGLPAKWQDDTGHGGFDPIDAAEKVVADYIEGSGPALIERASSAAYYSPQADQVVVPLRTQFLRDARFYGTLFHELTHSTGHASRLDREGVTKFDRFGSHQYSKEELVAEFGSAFLCGTTGVEPDYEQSAAYIAHWLSVLKNDKKLAVSAAGQAQRAADFILGISFAETEDNESEPAAEPAAA